jgi:hypothetical protein
MALAAAALLALILAGVAVVRWLGGDSTSGVASGTFLLSATPWAEVTEIVDADGVSQPLPPIPFTPIRLQLPKGEYQVTLRHPAAAEEQTVTLAIGGDTNRQTVVLEAADSAAYFRDLGW